MPSWSEIFNNFNRTKESDRISYLVKEKKQYLDEISRCTGRNVITYYSGWMQKPTAADVSINDADEILSKTFSDKTKRKEILKAFNNNNTTKVHSRHISKEKCKSVGLNIIDMEDDQHLQDMILSLHHCYMIYLEQTIVTKIVENNIGGCTMRLLNVKH